jgi:hypothetical protein
MNRTKTSNETIKFSCGHTAKVCIQYTSRESLERKIEWRETQGVCPDCLKQQQQADRQQESREAAAAAAEQGLPAIKGTPGQVPWAETIRSKLLDAISSEIENMRGAWLESEVVPLLKKSHAKVATETSANWFINNGRFISRDSIISLAMIATPNAEEVIDAAEDQILIQRITPEHIQEVSDLRRQITEKQATLERSQAAARAAQSDSEAEGSEYHKLKQEGDSWTDDQINGRWTQEMYANAHRRDEIESSWGWAKVDDIREELGDLRFREISLIKALCQGRSAVADYIEKEVTRVRTAL